MICAYRNCLVELPEERNPRRIYCSARCGQREAGQRLRDARRSKPDYRLGKTALCEANGCDEQFVVTSHNRRFCSRDCSSTTSNQRRKLPDRQCRVCGNTLRGKSHRLVYCGPACAVEGKAALRSIRQWHQDAIRPDLPSLPGAEIRKCDACNDLIVARSSSHRFCRYCRVAARRAVLLNVDVSDAVKVWEDDVCSGCGLPFDTTTRGTSPVLDHDHKTHKVRGKLHSNCNLAIGLLKDDPIRMIRLSIYLQEQAKQDVS